MTDDAQLKKIISISLILVLLVIAVIMLHPIILSIITAVLAAYMFHPAYSVLYKKLKRENLSAFIITLIAILIIIIPLIIALPMLVRQVFSIYTTVQGSSISDVLTKGLSTVFDNSLSTQLATLFNNFITKIVNSFVEKFATVAVNLPSTLLNVVIIVFTFFFVIKDAEKLEAYVSSLLPLSKETQKDFTQRSKEVTKAVVYGHVVIGVVQGLLTGLGLWIFGVDNVLTLTLVAMLLSVLPILGAWLVWLPAAIFLIMSGSTATGVGLLIYGVLIVSWIDNILRPIFISRRTDVNSALILIGMIGGFLTIGILGLVIGPLIIVYLLLVLEMYRHKKFDFIFQK